MTPPSTALPAPGTRPPATALLLLADGRFPAGGHAHSAGVEAAVSSGGIHDVASLEAFLVGRLYTVGLVDAALAAATVRRVGASGNASMLSELDGEADARIVVAGLRQASRKLGRQLLRVAARCWPHPVLDAARSVRPDGLHSSIVLGAVGVACGLGDAAIAALSVHHTLATPSQAAVRLLGLDPFAVAAVTASLSDVAAGVVDEAVAAAGNPLDELPASSAVLCDIAAEAHGRLASRLFAT